MKFIIYVLVVLSCMAVGNNSATAASYGRLAEKLTIVSADGKKHEFKVEQALTPQEQAQGLMFREKLDENAGMLFMFREEEERRFWMRNTLIPLDLLFIRKDGTIHHIHENARPRDETGLPSNGPVIAVLEINGGTSARLGIRKGDVVRHIFFTKP